MGLCPCDLVEMMYEEEREEAQRAGECGEGEDESEDGGYDVRTAVKASLGERGAEGVIHVSFC